jgi:hypothetical protein
MGPAAVAVVHQNFRGMSAVAPQCAEGIEVERKFRIGDMRIFEQKLRDAGAHFEGMALSPFLNGIEENLFAGEISFVDCYFDTVDFSLARKDYWLRTRDGQIELKMPLQRDSKIENAISTTTSYRVR